MPKMFFEVFIIVDANLQFDGTGTSQLIGLKCEDAMIVIE